jgi:tetratricopeptide (TPR) repeat protein
MRRLARLATTGVAAFATSLAVHAAEPAQSATVMGPSNIQLAQGATALDEGRVEEGIRLTLDGLSIPSPAHDKAAGHANLCAGYAMLKQWETALHHCNASLDLDKKNWRTYNNRASVYASRGQFDLAMKDIRSGLDLAPRSRTLHESLRIIQQNKRLLAARSRSSLKPP